MSGRESDMHYRQIPSYGNQKGTGNEYTVNNHCGLVEISCKLLLRMNNMQWMWFFHNGRLLLSPATIKAVVCNLANHSAVYKWSGLCRQGRTVSTQQLIYDSEFRWGLTLYSEILRRQMRMKLYVYVAAVLTLLATLCASSPYGKPRQPPPPLLPQLPHPPPLPSPSSSLIKFVLALWCAILVHV